MTTKNKRATTQAKDYLIVTPLSLETCLTEIEAMANFDLNVNINYQTDYHAEVQFVERHNDDLPLYITSRLIATQNGTCVTFELSEYVREGMAQGVVHKAQDWQSIIWILVVTILTMIVVSQVPQMILAFICVSPMFLFWSMVENVSDSPHSSDNFDIDKIRRLMLQRAEVLKADVYDVLYIDPTESRQDELGNEYYVDISIYNDGHV